MIDVVISGTGLYHPKDKVSNEELVSCFNAYVEKFNKQHAKQIAAGEVTALRESDAAFIEKASGIKSRYSRDLKNLLDPEVMTQYYEERTDDELCFQAEAGVLAAKQALKNANKLPSDIDAVIVACTHKQREYPAIAIEIQNALGITGFGFDMGVACSSATFGLQTAIDSIKAGHARAILVVTPEIGLSQVNFRDRDSHFIFGEADTAVVVERADTCKSNCAFKVLNTYLKTNFSNNIRNNSGSFIRSAPDTMYASDKSFYQEGRKVFKEVTPMVIESVIQWLAKNNLSPEQVKRYWLHQANSNMNRIIAEKLLGKDYDTERAPIVLDEFGNIAAAGVVVAFHRYHSDFKPGEYGVLCSFGAGYSIGCLVVEKI
jgi:beta-ketodecanoyl-[acyl-carrier-protein] synthase